MRHIHKLVVEEHEEHDDRDEDVGLAKGIARVEEEDVGWEDSKV